jgi:hypothetical protein
MSLDRNPVATQENDTSSESEEHNDSLSADSINFE